MDKRNIIIVALALAFIVTFNLVLQGNKPVKTESETMNASGIKPIPPSQELIKAFKQSSQNSAMAKIAELSCFPTSRYDCSLEEGCVSAPPGAYFFVDYGTRGGTYFRCSSKDCDQYPVKVVQSGLFTQFIPLQDQSMLFKVASDVSSANKGEFVDVATLGTSTLVSFGKCEMPK